MAVTIPGHWRRYAKSTLSTYDRTWEDLSLWDGATAQAILALQKRVGAKPDGMLGKRTLDALDKWRAKQAGIVVETPEPGDLGVDVSGWQDWVDWRLAKGAGVTWACVKLTENGSRANADAEHQIYGALAQGLEVGAYHFAGPEGFKGDATNEARLFARVLGEYPGLTMPPVLDIETRSPGGKGDPLPAKAVEAWCLEFLREFERITGVKAILYTYLSFARAYLSGRKEDAPLGEYPLWLAQYSSRRGSLKAWPSPVAWQYYSKAKVPGVWTGNSHHCDVNVSLDG